MFRIIQRVTNACISMRQQYIKWPTENEMQEIMENFESHDFPGLPRIIGVVDGTHIRIRAPTVNPDAYINRKKFYSLVTQMVDDSF